MFQVLCKHAGSKLDYTLNDEAVRGALKSITFLVRFLEDTGIDLSWNVYRCFFYGQAPRTVHFF